MAQFGLSQRYLQKLFIDHDCLRKVLWELATGSWTLALPHAAYALTTYSGPIARTSKLYLALAGLAVKHLYRPPQPAEGV